MDSPSLKLLFFGSGEFAVATLERLQCDAAPHRLLRVVTRPPQPAGRGKRLRPTPVAERCSEIGIPCEAPESANAPEFLERLASEAADLFIVADYGELLKKRFRAIPRLGVYNLHGSLLPRYRGAAPVVQALLAGDKVTGVTLFRIEKKLDAGPIVATRALELEEQETAGELEARLALVAADLLLDSLPAFASGQFSETEQDHEAATLAPKIEKRAAAIDWQSSAETICRGIRAYNPAPGAFTFLHRGEAVPQRTTVLRAVPHGSDDSASSGAPGTVVAVGKNSLYVACGEGRVEILQVQRAGKAPLDAGAYVRGARVAAGEVFSPRPETGGTP